MPHTPIKLSSPATKEFWEIEVLHEDDLLLAVNKPSRLLSSPDRYDPDRPNLMGLLHRDIARQAPWVSARGITYLANVHRLDFETSGILLLAKTKPALVHLANQFGSEKPLKAYVALVQGRPRERNFTVDAKLGPHPHQPGVVRVDPKGGKKSLTRFETLEEFERYTLIRCEPLTGRTHQIRVHLEYVRLPIAGDENYGGSPVLLSKMKTDYRLKAGKQERPLLARTGLHAWELTVTHPGTGDLVKIEAPWPKDLEVTLKYLRRYAF